MAEKYVVYVKMIGLAMHAYTHLPNCISSITSPLRKECIMKKHMQALMGLAFAAVFALAGCNAGSGTGTDSGDATSGDTATEASYTLVQEGQLIVASDLDFPPLDSFENGVPSGFDVDLSNEIGARLGLEVVYLPPQNFDSIIPMIAQGGKADIGNSAFSITADRMKEIDFTVPYLDSNLGVAVKKGAEATTEDALNSADKTIAVQAGTTGEAWARENLPNATIVPLVTVTEAMAGLASGLYDAVVADLPVIAHQCTISFTDCEVCIEIPTGEQYGIVVSKDNPGLTAAINQVLADMEADGTMDELKQKWFGDAM